MECEIVRDSTGKITGLKPKSNLRVHDVGGTNGIKDLVPEFLFLPQRHQNMLDDQFHFRYYHHMCEYLYDKGYIDGEDLFGAPYDFRLVLDPEHRARVFRRFRRLIERGGRPSVVVAHSMGCIMLKWFLSEMSQEWIEKHIARIVFVSPAFGGALFALRSVMSGDHYITMFSDKIREELRYNSGIVMCLPNELAFDELDRLWTWKDGRESVGIEDIAGIEGMATGTAGEMWRALYAPYLDRIRAKIDVPVFTVLANKKETPKSFETMDRNDYPHATNMGDGDGVLLRRSLTCYRDMFYEYKEMMLTGMDHTAILRDRRVLAMIAEYAR